MTAWKNAYRLCQEIDQLVSLNLFDYCSIYSAAIETADGGKLYMSDEYKKSYPSFAARYNDYLEDDSNIFKGCLELNRFIGHILSGTAALNHCRAGNGYFTLSPDASVHPCHRFIGDETMAINGGLKNVAQTPDFWKKTVNEREECSRCMVRYFCGGGCKQENLISTGSPLGISDKNCEFAQLLFDAAITAVDSLSDKSKDKLSVICKASKDLFVLCGQNVEATDRQALETLVKEQLGDFLSIG
jgi:radical SAM protein with 4Fe4S-binding SPASM domain